MIAVTVCEWMIVLMNLILSLLGDSTVVADERIYAVSMLTLVMERHHEITGTIFARQQLLIHCAVGYFICAKVLTDLLEPYSKVN